MTCHQADEVCLQRRRENRYAAGCGVKIGWPGCQSCTRIIDIKKAAVAQQAEREHCAPVRVRAAAPKRPRKRFMSFAGGPMNAKGGEKPSALNGRPATAGDKQSDRKPPISRGRLDQVRPGDGPQFEREGRAALMAEAAPPAKSAPRKLIKKVEKEYDRKITELQREIGQLKLRKKKVVETQRSTPKRGRPKGTLSPMLVKKHEYRHTESVEKFCSCGRRWYSGGKCAKCRIAARNPGLVFVVQRREAQCTQL